MDESKAPVGTSAEIGERLAFITEELNDVVKQIRGDKPVEELLLSVLDLDEIPRSIGNTVDLRLFRLFRFFAIRNITVGSLAGVCYRSGKDVGLSFSLATTGDLENLVRSLNLGTLVFPDLGERHITVRLHECATCAGIRNIGKCVCHFEGGLLAGALEGIFQKRVDLSETKCCAKGDEFCEFSLISTREMHKPRLVTPVQPNEAFSQENIQLLTTLATHSIAAIENAALFERTKQLVSIDGLTQLYNHRFFQERIRQELDRSKRHNLKLSLVMMDLDNFKDLNDRFGHPAGDTVLKKIAAVLMENVRGIDIVARYGGDEFALILPHTDSEAAFLVAERIKNKLEKLEAAGEDAAGTFSISMSMGVATFPDDAPDPEALIDLADRALLRVKRTGKGEIFRITS
ncbi:MAG: diguanylate cyclase [Deltaproteobacteria bacterium]|nr:diguanylate cyclase [Deltaproteobacteria bacterium]